MKHLQTEADQQGLVRVINHKGQQAVDARDLHAALGVRRDFSNWIKDRISKYGFVKNLDYEVLAKIGELENQKVRIDYVLTLGMAKELAMVQNNDKGREIRKYFIKCEQALKTIAEHQQQQQPTVEQWKEEQVRANIAAIEGKLLLDNICNYL